MDSHARWRLTATGADGALLFPMFRKRLHRPSLLQETQENRVKAVRRLSVGKSLEAELRELFTGSLIARYEMPGIDEDPVQLRSAAADGSSPYSACSRHER